MTTDDKHGRQQLQQPTYGLQSLAPTFHCPPSRQQQQQSPPSPSSASSSNPMQPQPPPRRKAKRRRKRHVPPGPAGVWFQSQQHHEHQQNQQHNNADKDDDSNRNSNTTTTTTTTTHSTSSITKQQQTQQQATADVSSCPVWMCMQHSLGLVTPYLPPYLTSAQRYEHLRPLPQYTDYIFLQDINGLQVGTTITTSTSTTNSSSQRRTTPTKLLVMVHACTIQHHGYWTVELRDECGHAMYAWMDPEFNEQQQQQHKNNNNNEHTTSLETATTTVDHATSANLSSSNTTTTTTVATAPTTLLQMGVVWLLENVKVLVVAGENDPSSSSSRTRSGNGGSGSAGSSYQHWLLVSREMIRRVWTPQQAAKEWSDVDYIEWMTKRSQLTTTTIPATRNDEDDTDQQEQCHGDDNSDVEKETEDCVPLLERSSTNRLFLFDNDDDNDNRHEHQDSDLFRMKTRHYSPSDDTRSTITTAYSLDARQLSQTCTSRTNTTRGQDIDESLKPNTGSGAILLPPPASTRNPYAAVANNDKTRRRDPQPIQCDSATAAAATTRFASLTSTTAARTKQPSSHDVLHGANRAATTPVPLQDDRVQSRAAANGSVARGDQSSDMLSSHVSGPPTIGAESNNNSLRFSQFVSPTCAAANRAASTRRHETRLDHHSSQNDMAESQTPMGDEKSSPSSVLAEGSQSVVTATNVPSTRQGQPNRTKGTGKANDISYKERHPAASGSSTPATPASAGAMSMSSVLSQFEARSSVIATENDCSQASVQVDNKSHLSPNETSHQKGRRSKEKKSKKSKISHRLCSPKTPNTTRKRRKVPHTKDSIASPKETSNLWLGADASTLMMRMLDDDEDDNQDNFLVPQWNGRQNNQISSEPSSTVPSAKANVASSVVDESSCTKEPSVFDQEAPRLFQASSVADMNLDGLFDEDE